MMKRSKTLGRLTWFILRHSPVAWLLLMWPPRAYVMIEHDNKLLLVNNWLGSGDWSFPGGGVHKGEDSKVGACREVFEEVGLKILPSELKFLTEGFVKYLFGGKKFIIYKVVLDNKPIIKLDPELNGYVWVDKDKVNNYQIGKEVIDSLKEVE